MRRRGQVRAKFGESGPKSGEVAQQKWPSLAQVRSTLWASAWTTRLDTAVGSREASAGVRAPLEVDPKLGRNSVTFGGASPECGQTSANMWPRTAQFGRVWAESRLLGLVVFRAWVDQLFGKLSKFGFSGDAVIIRRSADRLTGRRRDDSAPRGGRKLRAESGSERPGSSVRPPRPWPLPGQGRPEGAPAVALARAPRVPRRPRAGLRSRRSSMRRTCRPRALCRPPAMLATRRRSGSPARLYSQSAWRPCRPRRRWLA